MLLYENERTKSIVTRLVKIGGIVRIVTIAVSVIVLGVILSFGFRELWWLGGIIGILVGFALGSMIASFTTIIIEWMSQLLVAQGEILAALNKKP